MSDVDWKSVATKSALITAWHPIAYVQVLIRLGHEPIKPEVTNNMFFHEQLQYPNIFEYLMHIRKLDGFFGLYRGFIPRVCLKCSAIGTFKLVSDNLAITDDRNFILNSSNWELFEHSCKEMIAGCSAVIVSQPFYVITIRCMAQFVDRETVYDTLPRAVKAIYDLEGVAGFFKGLAPRIACEILDVWITNYLLRCYKILVMEESDMLKCLRSFWEIILAYRYYAQQISHPLVVTDTIMAVHGSKLLVENPPYLGFKYNGWIDCLHKVLQYNYSERGSTFFFRRAYTTLEAITTTGYSMGREEFEIISDAFNILYRYLFPD